jgi:hypothetical protein
MPRNERRSVEGVLCWLQRDDHHSYDYAATAGEKEFMVVVLTFSYHLVATSSIREVYSTVLILCRYLDCILMRHGVCRKGT